MFRHDVFRYQPCYHSTSYHHFVLYGPSCRVATRPVEYRIVLHLATKSQIVPYFDEYPINVRHTHTPSAPGGVSAALEDSSERTGTAVQQHPKMTPKYYVTADLENSSDRTGTVLQCPKMTMQSAVWRVSQQQFPPCPDKS